MDAHVSRFLDEVARAKAVLFGEIEDEVAARHHLAVPEDRAEVLRRLEALLV